MRKAIELGVLNLFQYVILTLDFRSVAFGEYLPAFFINILIAVLGATILKRLVEANTRLERVMYVLGSGFGTVLGIFSSHWVLGK